MTEDLKKLYDERVNRFKTTVDLQEPDRVPLISPATFWAISYAGYTYSELVEDYDKEADAYLRANQDFYYDGFRSVGVSHSIKLHMELGSHQSFISPNGVTPQHGESSSMEADEYDEFIADPFRFIANKIAVRKLDAFQVDDEEEVYKSMVRIFQKPGEVRSKQYVENHITEKTGLPRVTGRNMSHPIDQFFDYVRGFAPTMTDLRRRPEKVLAALEAMYPYAERQFPKPDTMEPFPWVADMHHLAKFLPAPLFEMLYWPFYRKSVETTFAAGSRFLSNFEGPWEHVYDIIQDLPAKSMIGIIDPPEVELFKKRFGNKFTIHCALSSGVLRSGNIDACIEEAKKVIDGAAPGGGFVWGSRMSLIAPGDADPDVLRAVNKYVFENATY
ncbi:MAG: hypothetical protein FWG10_13130 [Eubacteriaceae bacterium]|nr:hypothetical protein [Eubacteriaceae bacterium]